MFSTDNRIISLEIGEGLIKIANTDFSKGKRHITGLISQPIPTEDADAAGEKVRQIFQSLGIRPQRIQLNIPRHLLTVRSLKIPSIDDHEITKMVKMESFKHLPYTDEEVIYGHRIIEKLEDGYSMVLLALAQADTINHFINILNNAGIKGLASLSISSEALFSWYILAKKSDEKEIVMVINLDLSHIDIDVIEEDRLVFTRGVAYKLEGAKKINKIAEEINISINTYQKESNKTINRVVLTGGNSEIANCRAALTRELKIPVEIIEQVNNISIDENIKIPDQETSFAELLGLSLRYEDIKINLLPENVRTEARLVASKDNLITAIFLFAVFAAVAFGLLIMKLHGKNVYLSTIKTELKNIEPKTTEAKKMIKNINIIQQTISRKPLAIDILSEIYEITPGGIYLSMLDFESGKSLTIRGFAPGLSDVFKYVTILENSPYFEGVKVKYANKRMVENKEIADFEIDANVY